MNLISKEAIMKLTKEMYLKIANTKYDVHTISDCTSYVASKCREYIDERIRRKDIPSVFDGMTNGEAFCSVFDVMVLTIKDGKVWVEKIYFPFDEEWWNSPFQKGGE